MTVIVIKPEREMALRAMCRVGALSSEVSMNVLSVNNAHTLLSFINLVSFLQRSNVWKWGGFIVNYD